MKKYITPTVLDGALHVLFIGLLSLFAYLTSDEAKQYIRPDILFWIKGFSASIAAMSGVLSAYRSTSYASSVGMNKATDIISYTTSNSSAFIPTVHPIPPSPETVKTS